MRTFSPDPDFLEEVAWAEGHARRSPPPAPEAAAPRRPDAGGGPRFPCLDGLRALAAVSVLVFHVAASTGVMQTHPAIAPYVARLGALGVATFFALSGFLLYRPFAVAHLSGRPPPSTGGFYRRRFLRIFPAYWVAFSVYAYVFGFQAVHGARSGVLYYGLFQIYDRNRALTGLGQAWSLGTEISFYLALPLLAFAAHRLVDARRTHGRDRLRAEFTLMAALSIGSIVFRAWLVWVAPAPARFAITWLPSRLDWFGGGMLLAVASAWVGGRSRVVALLRVFGSRTAWCWAAAAGIFWVICHLGIPSDLQPETADQTSTSFVLFAVLACLLLMPLVFGDQQQGIVRGALRSRPLNYLGVVSYGVFLWHKLWIREVMRLGQHHPALAHLRFWPLLTIVLVVTVVSASASYHLVERPALAFKEPGSVRAAWRRVRGGSATI